MRFLKRNAEVFAAFIAELFYCSGHSGSAVCARDRIMLLLKPKHFCWPQLHGQQCVIQNAFLLAAMLMQPVWHNAFVTWNTH